VIDVEWVKTELIDRLAGRPDLAGVSVRREPPLRAEDFTGADPDVHAAIYFSTFTTTAQIEDVAAVLVGYQYATTLPVVCRVEARTASVPTALIDSKMVELWRAVAEEVSADPTLGLPVDPELAQLVVTVASIDQGPYQLGGEDLRWLNEVTVVLEVESTVRHPHHNA
jgi:hypothetical protein